MVILFPRNGYPDLVLYTHRVGIDLEAIQRFRIDAPTKVEVEQPRKVVSDEPLPRSRREIIYNRISEPQSSQDVFYLCNTGQVRHFLTRSRV